MLNIEDSALVIIDIQEKLVKAAKDGNKTAENMIKTAKAAHILSVPVIATEQYPKGLGSTVEELKNALSDDTLIIEKSAFSALSESAFKEKINLLGKKQIVIGGIEAHICVLQTAADLIKEGYEVYVLKDASSSRRENEFNTGIELLKQYGAKITCVEITIFEWLKTSKHPKFKEVQALIK